MSWKIALNSLLAKFGYMIVRSGSQQTSERSFESELEALNRSAAAIVNNWRIAQGHDVLAILGQFAGKIVPHGKPDVPHSIFVSRHNTYSPWLLDEEFQAWQKIVPTSAKNDAFDASITLVDLYRCWSIWKTVKQLASLHGDVIEIGVYRGGTSALIAHAIATSGQECKLYVCDTFSGVVKAGDNDTAYRGGEHADTSVDAVQKLVTSFLSDDQVIIAKGIFPDETGHDFTSKTFKFAHIDVDVYQSTIDCVDFLWPRMELGGVIIFDDYALQGTEGVTQAVEALASSYEDLLLVYNFNGQAMAFKIGASKA